MVRSIVEAHGGRIKVFSQQGQGTRIEFLLERAVMA
jgi:signal transduction histidine kinase